MGLSFIDTPFGDIDGDNQLLSGGADSTRVPKGVNNALNPQVRVMRLVSLLLATLCM